MCPFQLNRWCALAAAVVCATAAGAAVAPVALPDPSVPEFHFPESEATLTRWITDMARGDDATAARAFAAIHRHGWGLWTALTAETAQSYEGQRLRVFETWLGLDELADSAGLSQPAAPPPEPAPRPALRQLRPLRVREADQDRDEDPGHDSLEPIANRALGFVKFDPTAATHIVRQQLLRREALDTLLEAGATQVPPFPATALAVKPVFQIVRRADLMDGRYYALKAWSGPPSAAQPWAPPQWPACVWIDLANGGGAGGAVDPLGLADGSTRTEETTYPLSSVLHFRLSAADAAALNASRSTPAVSAGDVALLVAMHVSGREIARWTWQTFWWTPAPDAPPSPSSNAIAALQPAELRGAARHYAMTLAYTMLSPEQPYTGGTNAGPAVYAYNPWLEARLGPADLPGSQPGYAPDGRPAANNVGVASNCMSCHAQANYNPHKRGTAPQPSGARYVDLGAAQFVGTLQVDFLWSIARHAR